MRVKLFLATAVCLLALLAVSGSSRFDGAVVLAVTNSHGVHVLDFFVFALAAGALLVIASMRGTTGQH